MTDILIVEDSTALAGLLKDFLEKENYSVDIASSGEEALSLFDIHIYN